MTTNTNLDCNHSPLQSGKGAGGEAASPSIIRGAGGEAVAPTLLILGCGPGGYATASFAAHQGFKVTIFEKGEVGGTCLNRGCIPTKVYCHVASVLLEERKLHNLGIISSSPYGTESSSSVMPDLCFTALAAHKDDVVAQLRQGIDTLMAVPGITFVKGEAMLKDTHTVTCNGTDYTADYIIIATGSHSATPPIEGIDNPGVVSSTGLLQMDTLPHRLVIIGAGVIGMEMASAYSAFGSEVTVIEFLKECLPPMDQDLAKRLRKLLEKRGVKFYLNASAKSITKKVSLSESQSTDDTPPDQTPTLQVSFSQKGKDFTVDADIVLVATGRRPNTDGLGLEAVGIAYDRHGITVDDHFATSVPNIYAIGDVNGKFMLAHAAEAQGRHVITSLKDSVQSISNHKVQTSKFKLQSNKLPSAVFTVPELAGVGPTEAQLKAEGVAYTTHKSYYRANGKAVAMDATDGLVKIITDTDDHVIACHVLGAHAADLVQEATVLIDLGATFEQLQNIIHIHPTLGELMKME